MPTRYRRQARAKAFQKKCMTILAALICIIAGLSLWGIIALTNTITDGVHAYEQTHIPLSEYAYALISGKPPQR